LPQELRITQSIAFHGHYVALDTVFALLSCHGCGPLHRRWSWHGSSCGNSSLWHAQPFFGDLLGFIGAIATGPTTFWLPPLMWIILYRPVLTDVRLRSLLQCTAHPLVCSCLLPVRPYSADGAIVQKCASLSLSEA
jgi:hypothetical protein